MGALGVLLLVSLGAAGAPPVQVAIPAGESPAQWSEVATELGLVLGAAPGCPGVVLRRAEDRWAVRVCRGEVWLEVSVPAGPGRREREQALLAASRLLLLPVDSTEFQATVTPPPAALPPARTTVPPARTTVPPARTTVPPAEEPAIASRETMAAALAGVAHLSLGESTVAAALTGLASSLSPDPPLEESLMPVLSLEPYPTGAAWAGVASGLRVRGAAGIAAGLRLSAGWAWAGGLSLGGQLELEQATEVALQGIQGLDAGLQDRSIGGELGWRRGALQLDGGAGVSARRLRQGERTGDPQAVPWLELGGGAALAEGRLLVTPGASIRLELRRTALAVDGHAAGELPRGSVLLGLSFRLGAAH